MQGCIAVNLRYYSVLDALLIFSAENMRHEALINKGFAIQLTDKRGSPLYDLALCVTSPTYWSSPKLVMALLKAGIAFHCGDVRIQLTWPSFCKN